MGSPLLCALVVGLVLVWGAMRGTRLPSGTRIEASTRELLFAGAVLLVPIGLVVTGPVHLAARELAAGVAVVFLSLSLRHRWRGTRLLYRLVDSDLVVGDRTATTPSGDASLDQVGVLSGPDLDVVGLSEKARERIVTFASLGGRLRGGELTIPLPRGTDASVVAAREALLVAVADDVSARASLASLFERWDADPAPGVRLRVAELALRPGSRGAALRETLVARRGWTDADGLAAAIPALPPHEQAVAVDALSRVATEPVHFAVVRRYATGPWLARARQRERHARSGREDGRLSVPEAPDVGRLTAARRGGELSAAGVAVSRPRKG
jgi:putative effector of murein hydrolase LrgA (UPF0299 family)